MINENRVLDRLFIFSTFTMDYESSRHFETPCHAFNQSTSLGWLAKKDSGRKVPIVSELHYMLHGKDFSKRSHAVQ